MLALTGDPRLSREDVEQALVALLGGLEGRKDGDGVAALYMTELALAARSAPDAERFAAARDALALLGPGQAGAEQAAWNTARLANAHVAAGRLEEADSIARFGVEAVDLELAWSQAPRLWHVLAEVARLQGRWVEAGECLDEMEASVRADDASELSASAGLLAQNREYRARLSTARAQSMLELGLLDQCGERLADARRDAERSGVPAAMSEARLLELDRLLLSERFAEAIREAREAQDEPSLTAWKQLFLLSEGTARAELARQQAVADECFVAHSARARACLHAALEAEQLLPAERLKAWLTLADLALTLEHFEEADAALRTAEELTAASGGELGSLTREAVLIGVHRWRWASASDAGGEEVEVRRRALDEAFERFLEQWDRTPRRPGGIGFLHFGWRQLVVSEVLHADRSAGRPERAFERLLEAQAHGTFARGLARARPLLEEIRSELLAPERGILVLLPARDRSHLFVLYGQEIEAYELASADEVRQDARRIAAALARADGTIDAGVLRRLSGDLLPAAVRAHLGEWEQVYTVGFDLLQNVPFGLLLDEGGEPYGEKLAVVSMPSLPHGLELARRPAQPWEAAQDLVLVAAPQPPPGSKLAPFPFGRAEQEALAAPFERTQVLVGSRATKAELLASRTRLSGAGILHFFTHGIEEAERECSAALVLAPDGETDSLLRAEDVAALELHGLVILSACGSGRGPQRLGDDQLVHLGGAFLDAGARCVVLSRYPVTFRATHELMTRLHRHLAAGDAPAEALRKARVEGARPDAVRSATFEVLGAGFEPVVSR